MPILFAIASCAQLPPPAERTGPLLEPPLPPATLGQELALSEVVTGDYGDHSYSMRVELEITPERLVVVGLSHLGVPLFTLEQTAADLRVQSNARGPLPFDPARMLSDLQLVHWPAGVLAAALDARRLRLEDRPGDCLRRVVDQGGRPLVEIVYPAPGAEPAVTTLRHLDHPYRLRIEAIAEPAAR
jgi:Protein of unknown function (DUF3261)